MDRDALRELEETAARAWPPRRIVDVDGWTVRLSGGGSKRANSAQTLRWRGRDLDDAIDAVERLYAEDEQPAIFQVASVAEPDGLDAALEARGYAAIDATLLMVKPVAEIDAPHDVAAFDDPPSVWFEIYLSTITPDRQATARHMVEAIPRPRAFFVASNAGGPFAAGLAAAEGRFCGIECMATRAAARRSGGAARVLAALEAWARVQGATTLWLQVMESNAPARALYDKLGFRAVGGYRYRVKEKI